MSFASKLLLDEIAQGQGITLRELAKLVPSSRQGKAVSISCCLRWVIEGVKTPDGRRVHLEAARLSGRWLTSKAALRRFLDDQTPAIGEPVGHPGRVEAGRNQLSRHAAAAKKLKAIGI